MCPCHILQFEKYVKESITDKQHSKSYGHHGHFHTRFNAALQSSKGKEYT